MPMLPNEALLFYFSDLDRHFGRLMEKISGGDNQDVFLAAALTSRSNRGGHVCLDLAEYAGRPLMADIREEPEDEILEEMPESILLSCPPLSIWRETLLACSVVGTPGEYKPLILDDKSRLYLYRYWSYEDTLVRFIKSCGNPAESEDFRQISNLSLDLSGFGHNLQTFFPEDAGQFRFEDDKSKIFPDWQKIAALAVLRNRLVVISGSPGTGKTTTAARALALLQILSRGPKLRIALAAPTGKAAVRLDEAMNSAYARVGLNDQQGKAMTVHRLLGTVAGSPYFRHGPGNPLPYDVIVVDEASMVDLPLMAKLVQALSPASRLILLGDRDQLASVEAGAVLGDLCGPDDAGNFFSQAFRQEIRRMIGESCLPPVPFRHLPPVSDSMVQLQKNYRFDENSGIGQLSRAVNRGDKDRVFSILNSSRCSDIAWENLPDPLGLPRLIEENLIHYFRKYMKMVINNENPEVIFDYFERFRILCALRRGPFGVVSVNALLESMLRSERLIAGSGRWYPGRPIMINRNDYSLGLFNGDVGLTLSEHGGSGLSVFFRDSEGNFRRFAPFRLPEHETVYAMTVHKSQGSEFDEVLMILSDRDAPLLTRELIYTGVSRAKKGLLLWGREEILRQAISRRIKRTSGLRDALWESAAVSDSCKVKKRGAADSAEASILTP